LAAAALQKDIRAGYNTLRFVPFAFSVVTKTRKSIFVPFIAELSRVDTAMHKSDSIA
jgi:hypothetical protein